MFIMLESGIPPAHFEYVMASRRYLVNVKLKLLSQDMEKLFLGNLGQTFYCMFVCL